MRLTERVHLELKRLVQEGDICIDATAGNGHDTLALAQLVGGSGRVIAVDIQEQAIEATRNRVGQHDTVNTCEFILGDHAAVLTQLVGELGGAIAALTFNLGYLPGSDKSITTEPEQTLAALDASAQLLRPGGALLVTAYRGHAGGSEEAERVEGWMRAQESTGWAIEPFEPSLNDKARIPPILWIARKPK